jgi:hypothetical protein
MPLRTPAPHGEEPWPDFNDSQPAGPPPETPPQESPPPDSPAESTPDEAPTHDSPPDEPLHYGQPEPPAAGRPAAVRVALLIGLLCVVTAGGILLGRAVEPSSTKVTTTAASTPTTTTTVRPKPRSKTAWGPIPARLAGRLSPAPGRAAIVVSRGTLVVIGGTAPSKVLAGKLGGVVKKVVSLPGTGAAAQAFALAGTVYAIGGEHGATPADEILRLEPSARGAVPAGTFVEPLAEAGVATRGGSAYLVGGWTGTKYATAVLRFTPPSREDLVARLPEGLRSPAVALAGHTLWVAGGRTQAGLSRQVYAVDIDTGHVTSAGRLPRGVQQALLVTVAGKLYLLGGRASGGKALATILRIVPATGRIKPAGRMPQPLAGATAAAVGKQTLVVSPTGAIYRLG